MVVELMAHCPCAWRYGALGLWTMRGYEPLRSRAAHAAEMRGIGQHGFMADVGLGGLGVGLHGGGAARKMILMLRSGRVLCAQARTRLVPNT